MKRLNQLIRIAQQLAGAASPAAGPWLGYCNLMPSVGVWTDFVLQQVLIVAAS